MYACVVVLYNPEQDIKEQLKVYTENFDKLYIFDNSPKKQDWLEEITNINNVTYIGDGTNKGLSGAFNITFERAKEEGFEFLVTMDQDTIFESAEIQKMKKHIEECTDENVAIFGTNFKKRYQGKEGIEYSDPIYPVDTNSDGLHHLQSGSFLKTSLMQNVFPLDDWFIAFVDFDMNYSAVSKGYKILVYGDCMITQQIGNSIKASKLAKKGLTNMSVNRFYYLMRNNLYFAKKYNDNKEAKKFARKRRIIYILKIILSEKNKILKIKMMKKGYKDFKLGKLGELKD